MAGQGWKEDPQVVGCVLGLVGMGGEPLDGRRKRAPVWAGGVLPLSGRGGGVGGEGRLMGGARDVCMGGCERKIMGAGKDEWPLGGQVGPWASGDGWRDQQGKQRRRSLMMKVKADYDRYSTNLPPV